MKYWRMSFKMGTGGPSMLEDCVRRGIAAITYRALAETDLSKHEPGQPKDRWKALAPTQQKSLHRVVYEMKEGDVIFAKDGPKIVNRGKILGGYQFDSTLSMCDPRGTPWPHHVPVQWSSHFPPIKMALGRSQRMAVEELPLSEAEEIAEADTWKISGKDMENFAVGALCEDAFYRESPAISKFIVRRHNELSNSFCSWLDKRYQINAVQEQRGVDVRFNLKRASIIAELKVCLGPGTTRSIREALGQLLEYNHYPQRTTADSWLIVLDERPSRTDKDYISALRERLSIPVALGWQADSEFCFHPEWPDS